jgi:hypothetical protein
VKIDYFLPETRAQLTASVTTVTYQPDEGGPAVSDLIESSHSFALVTGADAGQRRVVTINRGFWRDCLFDVGLTEDGRLTSFGSESVGHAGAILATGVTVAAAAAALAVGQIPAAVTLAGAAAAHADQALGEEEAPPVPDPAWRAYSRTHAVQAERYSRLTEQRRTTQAALDAARAGLIASVADAADRQERSAQVAALETVLSALAGELAEIEADFAAWHASLPRTVQAFDALLPLAILPRLVGPNLVFADDDQQALNFWQATGWVLATVGEPGETASRGAGEAAAIGALRPRSAVFAHVQRVDDAPVVTRYDHALVMDAHCTELSLPLSTSFWGRERTAFRLSALGALTGISLSRTAPSSGASASSVASDISSAISSALYESKPGSEPAQQHATKPAGEAAPRSSH